MDRLTMRTKSKHIESQGTILIKEAYFLLFAFFRFGVIKKYDVVLNQYKAN